MFLIWVLAMPIISYSMFFQRRMDPDPHGMGAFFFVVFIFVVNPIVAFLGSAAVWLLVLNRREP